jgi:hypothetical protein
MRVVCGRTVKAFASAFLVCPQLRIRYKWVVITNVACFRCRLSNGMGHDATPGYQLPRHCSIEYHLHIPDMSAILRELFLPQSRGGTGRVEQESGVSMPRTFGWVK